MSPKSSGPPSPDANWSKSSIAVLLARYERTGLGQHLVELLHLLRHRIATLLEGFLLLRAGRLVGLCGRFGRRDPRVVLGAATLQRVVERGDEHELDLGEAEPDLLVEIRARLGDYSLHPLFRVLPVAWNLTAVQQEARRGDADDDARGRQGDRADAGQSAQADRAGAHADRSAGHHRHAGRGG